MTIRDNFTTRQDYRAGDLAPAEEVQADPLRAWVWRGLTLYIVGAWAGLIWWLA
ncbi:hypothetical protein [Aurantiacibacter spongiae]|uniref:hypothetical protein n=1 Tax=Aurantiacibacter spongiae TaxID=2488860 RepID=UPI001315A8C7|nr:hypothetical protein [Aurantiacibacter spongiae]